MPIVITQLDHTTVPVTLVILEMGIRVQVNEDHVYCQWNFIADTLLKRLLLHNQLSTYTKCLQKRKKLNRSVTWKVIFDFLFPSNSNILLL